MYREDMIDRNVLAYFDENKPLRSSVERLLEEEGET
jgi:hypothetical protein